MITQMMLLWGAWAPARRRGLFPPARPARELSLVGIAGAAATGAEEAGADLPLLSVRATSLGLDLPLGKKQPHPANSVVGPSTLSKRTISGDHDPEAGMHWRGAR
uniref:Uncharacterized protein n=1 Tax=Eutreptiella gymnastica TaxID=73025 RepID=A0A7S4GMP7_9EUGL